MGMCLVRFESRYQGALNKVRPSANNLYRWNEYYISDFAKRY